MSANPPPPRADASEGQAEGVCLITGASGFIGGQLARRLAGEGGQVRCLVRESSEVTQLEQLGVELVVGDLTEPRSLLPAVQGCTRVLHCAALVSDWASTEEIVAANVSGTRSMLEAAAQASVRRFVHFSSTDVYSHPGRAQVEESYVTKRFGNWYASSKRDAEAEVRRAHSEHALETVILRPATVYGPGSREVIGEIARAIQAHHMLLIGGGRAVAGLCYVENLADAAILALTDERANGHAINLSDGLAVTWRELCDDLAGALDCPPVSWSMPYPLANAVGFALEHGYRLLRKGTGLSAAPLLSRQAVQVLGVDQDFSNRRAHALLGWTPRVDYAEGLAATVCWLQDDYLPGA